MATAVTDPATDADFDLDVTFMEIGTAFEELMNSTSDNCGGTDASACAGCILAD